MIEKESEWILPGNLRKQEERERKAVADGTFDGSGDFGSYSAYRRGYNCDFIKPHAVSSNRVEFAHAKQMSFILINMG